MYWWNLYIIIDKPWKFNLNISIYINKYHQKVTKYKKLFRKDAYTFLAICKLKTEDTWNINSPLKTSYCIWHILKLFLKYHDAQESYHKKIKILKNELIRKEDLILQFLI